jgi:hypothetical protein
MKFAAIQGLPYLPSMAIGILIASPVSIAMQFAMPSGEASVEHARIAAAPALLAGTVWNAGNALSMVATRQV